VDPETRPAAMAPPFTGHFRVTADTPRGLQPFLPAAHQPNSGVIEGHQLPPNHSQNGNHHQNQIIQEKIAEATSNSLPSSMQEVNSTDKVDSIEGRNVLGNANLLLRRDIVKSEPLQGTVDLLETPITPPTYHCFSCGVDLNSKRYHSLKVPDYDLCEGCYLEGRFPSQMFSGDFVQMKNVEGHLSSSDWSDQEILLLLEAVEMYESDWSAVAAHVATKSREQCIVQFLKLPIEDPYIGVPIKELGPLQYHRNSFNDTENPILSVLAFLASTVDSKVAKLVAESVRDFTGDHKLHQVGATTLGMACAKGHSMAAADETEMHKIMQEITDLQVKKVELKLAYFDQLESALDLERRELERQKQAFFLEKLAFKRSQLQQKATAAATTSMEPETLTFRQEHAFQFPPNTVSSEVTSSPAPPPKILTL
jgi:SWI/SNF related-matrix-associated actin-dependent regulator of chromatin subfamily C